MAAFTYDLLCSLRDQHPGVHFAFVIGSDWLLGRMSSLRKNAKWCLFFARYPELNMYSPKGIPVRDMKRCMGCMREVIAIRLEASGEMHGTVSQKCSSEG